MLISLFTAFWSTFSGRHEMSWRKGELEVVVLIFIPENLRSHSAAQCGVRNDNFRRSDEFGLGQKLLRSEKGCRRDLKINCNSFRTTCKSKFWLFANCPTNYKIAKVRRSSFIHSTTRVFHGRDFLEKGNKNWLQFGLEAFEINFVSWLWWRIQVKCFKMK